MSATRVCLAPAHRSRADQADLAVAQPYGQFAAATAVALATGREITGTDTGAACFAGAWVASVFGTTEAGQLGSWPGDADEALDLIRSRPGATFEQVAGLCRRIPRGSAAAADHPHPRCELTYQYGAYDSYPDRGLPSGDGAGRARH